MKRVTVLLCCTGLIVAIFAFEWHARHKAAPYQVLYTPVLGNDSADVYYSVWNRVDYLLQNRLPKSAAALIDSIYTIAKNRHEPVFMMKAQLYYLALTADTSENALQDMIVVAEKRANEEVFPYNALWQSITAQLYWDYYQSKRYVILQRTRINGGAQNDFEQWGADRFFSKIAGLYTRSVSKSALLEETPWVMEAKNETQQRHRVALLFQANKLAAGLQNAVGKLAEMQLPSGGFTWFKGGRYEDDYITQYIVTGIGRLKHLGVTIPDERVNRTANFALTYLDNQLKKEYDFLKTSNTRLDQRNLGYGDIQYLYMRSFFKDIPISTEAKEAYNYYKKQAITYQASYNDYMRGMIALALDRDSETKIAGAIISSLKETAHHTEEMGMYWTQTNSYWWYEAPIEAQAVLIECFSEIARDGQSVDAMKLWLLKQKQTRNWHTTKSTADACYALLLNGSQWLDNEPSVTISLGKEVISSATSRKEAGTGYFTMKYGPQEVKPDMGNLEVAVSGNEHGTSWGGVYWQYFENLDRVSSAATSIEVKKRYFINQNSANGTVLVPLNNNHLKVGDKVTVRIEVTADRDMDYVHLKDMRPACFEPINVISEYKYQGGMNYYEATRDAATNFFISHLGKGKYVLEYPVYVTHSGDFSAGISTLQCMYAPEFCSHSEGVRVRVD